MEVPDKGSLMELVKPTVIWVQLLLSMLPPSMLESCCCCLTEWVGGGGIGGLAVMLLQSGDLLFIWQG